MPRTNTSLPHLWRTRFEKVLSKKKNQEAKLKLQLTGDPSWSTATESQKVKKKDESDNCSFVRSFVSLVRSTKYWYSRPFSINLIFIFFILSAVPSTFFLKSQKKNVFLLKFHKIRCFNRTKNSRAYQYTLLI
jgi:hypothetical protein